MEDLSFMATGDLVYKSKRTLVFFQQSLLKHFLIIRCSKHGTEFYLSNRFINPIIFGIILKSYLFSMVWHKFREDIIMQTRKILL